MCYVMGKGSRDAHISCPLSPHSLAHFLQHCTGLRRPGGLSQQESSFYISFRLYYGENRFKKNKKKNNLALFSFDSSDKKIARK